MSNVLKWLSLLLFILFSSLPALAELYSTSPRVKGEEILMEIVQQGKQGFTVRVGSNGCTSRNSFTVAVKKEKTATQSAPHYQFTIIRTVADECKAIVYDGELVTYDLQKDFGITGNFDYSITNKLISSSTPLLHAAVHEQKAADLPLPGSKEARPPSYEQFRIEHDFFSCLVPSAWTKELDRAGNEKAGIFQLRLTMTGKAKPEDGENYFLPDPLIYVGYYASSNSAGKSYRNFISDYETLRLKHVGSAKSAYNKPVKTVHGRNQATINAYEVYQEIPRGPLFVTKYWLKARFVVIKAHKGFYVVALKSPKQFYDAALPVFQTVLDSFKPLT